MLQLNHLYYFYRVAKDGGFTRAARSLRIAQPAVSKIVKQLETSFGEALFEREKKAVHLTRFGNSVFRSCEKIFAEVEVIARRNETTAEGQGELALGASEAIASHLLPSILSDLRAAHPRLVPSVTTAPASWLCEQLTRGETELALLFHVPPLGPELEVRARFLIEHRVVIAAKRFDDERTRLSFIGSREIDSHRTRSFPTLRRLRRDRPQTGITVSTNSLTAHRALALRGAGVAVLPLFMVREDLRRGKLRCLYPREKFAWPLSVVQRRGQAPSRNGELLLGALRDSLGA